MGDPARLVSNTENNWLLQGELNFSTVPVLFQGAGPQMRNNDRIEVDLAGVTRADSAGLALLVEWLRESEVAGKSISFINVPVQLLSIARVCGLENILSLK